MNYSFKVTSLMKLNFNISVEEQATQFH